MSQPHPHPHPHPTTNKIPLNHKSFQDLFATATFACNKQTSRPVTSVKWVETNAGKLMKDAESFMEAGDEEKSCICYMQAASLYKKVPEDHKDFILDPDLYNSIVKCHLDEANLKCEELKASLEMRYEQNLQEQYMASLLDSGEGENQRGDVDSVGQELVKLKAKTSLTVHEFKKLLESDCTLLIVDHRPFTDFVKGHLNHPNCICISPDFLGQAGKSAFDIEIELSTRASASGPLSHWRKLWRQRGQFDKVVLYDSNSTWESLEASIFRLYEAVQFNLDPAMVLQPPPPALLSGGFTTLYKSFPSLVVVDTAVSHSVVKSGLEQGDSGGNTRPGMSFAAALCQPVPAQAQNVKKIEMTTEEFLMYQLNKKEEKVEHLMDIVRRLNGSLKEANDRYKLLEQMSFLNRVGDPCHLGTRRRCAGATKLDAGQVFYCGKKKVICSCWNKRACDGICGRFEGCPCEDCLQLTYDMIPNISQKNISLSPEAVASPTSDAEDPVQVARRLLLEAEDANKFRCIICFENKRAVALDPCGHYSYCEDCALKINECSICRQRIHKTLTVFDG